MGIRVQEYRIHDNGGRPFTVKIYIKGDHSRVEIFVSPEDEDSSIEVDKPFFDRVVEKVFVGESPKNAMTEFSGGHGPNFRGNSILLHVKDKEYVFVGWKVYSFQALSNIIQFVSPVGNSDVPYPYAVDVDNRGYLLIEDVIVQLPKEKVKEIPLFDPYDDWYRNKQKFQPLETTVIHKRLW